MENHVLSPLYVAKLPINSIYALNKSIIELATPVKSELGPIAGAALTNLDEVNQNLAVTMNKNQKSEFSVEVKSLDGERDADIGEIKRMTSSYLKSSDAAKKSAASTLQLFLAPYWGMAALAQDVETGVVDEMLVKYNARPELKAATVTIGIDGLFITLETKNSAFNTKFKSRNTEYSERDPSASTNKPAAVAANIQFCTSLELAVNFTPNDTNIALFNKVDELRKNYHAQEDNGKDKPTDAPAK
ncbi:MAG TPA: DUF6261 family protein [Paludibacter sp.]|nr:DUF6261 family protein [Paludibacter sp.]